jgi:betaine-aldehyde dehydrogenase
MTIELTDTLASIKAQHWPMIIGGADVEGAGDRFERRSPGHDVVVGSYAAASTADVDAAVAAARTAFEEGPWRWTAGAAKARVLRGVAAAIENEIESLARIEALESGKPISQARDEMRSSAEIWYYAASLAQHTHGDAHNGLGADHIATVVREPIGVAGVICPWNFPFLIASQKIPFALAAGCSVVIKASNFTPGTTARMVQMLRENGLPDGVANVVQGTGDVGRHLAAHPGTDMTTFTGSTQVGRSVMAAAAETLKHVSLELGGKNPQTVMADADLDAAAAAVSWGAYFNQGECCNAGSRLLVQDSIADEFVERVVALSKKVKVGDPLADDTEMGAIISDQHLGSIDEYVQSSDSQGARVASGGTKLDSVAGRYYAPTVIADVQRESTLATDEVFGPVLSVIRFSELADAVAITNGTPYGLSSGIWTSNLDNAVSYSRAVRAGTVWVNTWMDGFPEVPFGGVGESGVGRELGRSALDEFTESKSIVMKAGTPIGVHGTQVR